MKKTKILYIHQSAGGGGASNSLALLVSSLDRSKYEPVVILGRYGSLVELFKRKSIKIYVRRLGLFGVNTHSPKISFRAILSFVVRFLPNIFTVYRIIKNEKIQIVHINSSVLLISMFAAHLTGVKVVCHIRELIPNTKIGKLQKKIIKFISLNIIAISKEVKKQFDDPKTILIYNGINQKEFKPNSEIEMIRRKYKLNEKETVFTHIGQLFSRKGSYIFLKAAELLIKSNYNVRFFVVGGSPSNTVDSSNISFIAKIINIIKWFLGYRNHLKNNKEKLEMFARDLGITEKVIFTGYRNDVQNFIALSDAVVAPHCVPEPFGRVLIEAGALRKPIISTNIPPTPEIVIDGKTGLLVEPNNPNALVKAMEYIIDNPVKARQMGENGYRNVVDNFHIDLTHSKIIKLYEKILNKRRLLSK